MAKRRNAWGEPSGFRKESPAYYVHGLHGMKTPTLAGRYDTKAAAVKAAKRAAKEEGEPISVSTPKGPIIQVNPAKFDRCVKAVKKRGGAANAYAVCTAAGTRKNPAKQTFYYIGSNEFSTREKAVAKAKQYLKDDPGYPVRITVEHHHTNEYGKDVTTYGDDIIVNPSGRKNPAGAAVEAYKDFHGQDPTEMVTVTSTVHFHRHLSGAGDLKYLVIDTPDGKYRTTVKFGKGVLLAFNERKNQLFIEGGDQSVNLKDFGIEPGSAHELETLGKATRIGYFTEKVHLRPEDGGKAVYDHKFRMTNQNGQHVTVKVAKYPDVIYRVIDQHLEFSGGSYKILSEGIDK